MGELCGFFRQAERVNKGRKVAVHHICRTVYCQVHPVINDIVMIKIIGADTIAAFAPADLGFPVFSHCILLLCARLVQQAGPQYAEGFGFVGQLAALVLARDDKAGRQMSYPDGAVGGVHSLTAVA